MCLYCYNIHVWIPPSSSCIISVCKWILKYATDHYSHITFSSSNPVTLLPSLSVGFREHSRALTLHVQWLGKKSTLAAERWRHIKMVTCRQYAMLVKKKKNACLCVIAMRYYVIYKTWNNKKKALRSKYTLHPLCVLNNKFHDL